MVVVFGFAGLGKTELIKRWLASQSRTGSSVRFDGAFWFSFNRGVGFEAFIDAICKWLELSSTSNESLTTNERMRQVLAELQQNKLLIVIDNFERLLDLTNTGESIIRDHLAFEFFESVRNIPQLSSVVVLSRSVPADIVEAKSENLIKLEGLTDDEGWELLSKFGLTGEDSARQDLLDRLERHPIRLAIAAKYILHRYDGNIEKALEAGSLEGSEFMRSFADVLRRYDEMLSELDLDIACLVAQARQDCTAEFLQRTLQHATCAANWDPRVSAMKVGFETVRQRLTSLYLLSSLPANGR